MYGSMYMWEYSVKDDFAIQPVGSENLFPVFCA